jgi:uncharacterized protein YraI
MRQLWFKAFVGAITMALLGAAAFISAEPADAFQDASTPTGIFVTVTYSDPINVRSGPSTRDYPIVGQLNPGDMVPALGISPGREWIQVSYPGGTGWVYSSFVSISGGELMVLEPPPTPTPLATATIDPTLAAEFNIKPTETRMPTFTPPPPLEVPQFTDNTRGSMGATGIFIVILGLLGGAGLLASYLLRK